ncbi:MAG: twin-arginine translocase subunit TatC [Prevotella sp.]|nr:twin-arginine translocase subunit TatC [Prevotella sp.]
MSKDEGLSFWDHLDVLRTIIIRIILVTVVCGIVAFLFKEELFAVVLAPRNPDFVTYRLLVRVSGFFGGDAPDNPVIQLINTGLAEQFVIHMKTALCAGVLCASPYTLYQLFRFVSPALYANERRFALPIVVGGYVMFMLGVLISYYLIFPLTFRFLGTYQVSEDVVNMISLQSYMSTLTLMSISMGIVFEMPVVAWLMARMGLLTASFMNRYRRHAIVVILIVAAIITPTSDIFTLLMVSLPMWLLYEVSVCIVRVSNRG